MKGISALAVKFVDPVHQNIHFIYSFYKRSGGGVVDNTLDYQSRGRKIDPPLLRSFG